MTNVIQFSQVMQPMSRNDRLQILLCDFFETHDVHPGDALEIMQALINDINLAAEH